MPYDLFISYSRSDNERGQVTALKIHIESSFRAFAGCAIYPDMSSTLESSEAAILNRIVRPDAGDWPREAAETILGLGFNRSDRERMTRLLEKAKAGNLSPEQAEVLEN